MTDRSSTDSGIAEVDVLMPNGFLLHHVCDRRSSFGTIKPLLWEQALKLPTGHELRNSDQYVFVGVTKDAKEIVFDDSDALAGVDKLITYIVQLEPAAERTQRRLAAQIDQVIGEPVSSLDCLSGENAEIRDARLSFKSTGEAVVKERERWTEDERAKFFFPPRFDVNPDLPITTERAIRRGQNQVKFHIWHMKNDSPSSTEIKVPAVSLPMDLVAAAKDTIESNPGNRLTQSLRGSVRHRLSNTDVYVLKRCDSEEYFLEERELHTYEYIRGCINRGETPRLQLVDRDQLMARVPHNDCTTLRQGSTDRCESSDEQNPTISSWSVSHDCNYTVILRQMPVAEAFYNQYSLEVRIYHGDQALCARAVSVFNKPCEFDLPIQSIPKSARLCFILREKAEPKHGHCWFNMQIFDHKGRLVTGPQKFAAWTFPEAHRKTKHPFGTPGTGRKPVNRPCIAFDVVRPTSAPDGDIAYPSDEEIKRLIKREEHYQEERIEETSFLYLNRIYKKEMLNPLTAVEKKELWKSRYLALDYRPAILPRIIQCVDWKDRLQIFELYQLLDGHRLESVTVALQLLGPEYPDAWVRRLAVEYIDRHLTPELLDLYLLQLVQCLLFECYQDNALAQMLLRKSLSNKTIGHNFFWLLRSEMSKPLSRLRFTPLLESFVVNCGSAILTDRLKEVETCEFFQTVTKELKDITGSDPETLNAQTNCAMNMLERQVRRGQLQNLTSVMDKSLQLGELQLSKCKVMRSKMRPIWVSWSNSSLLCPESGRERLDYIVKNGDDLRQDMLVLQMLKVMDMIWKGFSHDYWMTIYGCMSTGENFGIIEAVRDTQTVCDIELDNTTQLITTKSMDDWIERETGGGERQKEARNRFAYSCAAYTVATYLLGIGDRHSDNIMLKNSGEMFHIDFGHFMGHRKSKAGIQRERLPFIITKDFVAVISGEKDGDGPMPFDEFMFLCYEAFMTIRQNGTLFLTLLNLMKHCNLPELNSDLDLQYCRGCLGLDKPEHEVAKEFCGKLLHSFEKQWMTKLNWFFHRFHRVMQSNKSSSDMK